MNKSPQFVSNQPPLTKDELEQTIQKVNLAQEEVDGALQCPDTERVLHTHRLRPTFFEALIQRLIRMAAFRPIIGNIIAILCAVVGYSLIETQIDLGAAQQWKHILDIVLLAVIAIQVLKSATRSLLLPCVTIIIGLLGSHSLILPHRAFFISSHVLLQGFLLCGITHWP